MKLYINILGLSGSGKTSLVKKKEYIYNRYCNVHLTNYGKKGLKEKIINNLKYNFNNPNEKKEIIKILKIFKEQSNEINRLENYIFKINIINKTLIHKKIIEYNKNVIIDEGVLSLFDNLIIHPKFIDKHYDIKRYLDTLTVLPSHIIYISETTDNLIKRYYDRNNKPWKLNENYNLEVYFKKALIEYDKYIDTLVKNYNITIINKNNIESVISQNKK